MMTFAPNIHVPEPPRVASEGDFAALSEWLHVMWQQTWKQWYPKQRALGASLTYDSQDRVAVDAAAIVAAIVASPTLLASLATALAPYIDHGSLDNLGVGDPHPQYVFGAPTADARNEIHPAAGVVALTLFGESNAASHILDVWDNPGNLIIGHIEWDGAYVDDP